MGGFFLTHTVVDNQLTLIISWVHVDNKLGIYS